MAMEREPLNICMKTMAASSSGIAKKTSVMRERRASNHPPKYPARAPMVPPMRETAIVVRMPTETEARAP